VATLELRVPKAISLPHLYQQASQRLASLGNVNIQVAAPVIVSGEEHRFLASEQLREVGIALSAALFEPTGRNTAQTLTLAALAVVQMGQDPMLIVMPANQTIANTAAFTAAVQQAFSQAIEPIIGHLKADHLMDRCHLKGSEGDALHAVVCAAGYHTAG
jgi:mannose-1-phosphate guanylyltransferase